MSDLFSLVLLVFVGLIAGFINVVSGGGSLLTLPVLIFLGLDSTVANASNRVGILFQNIFAIQGFRKSGVSAWPYSFYISLSALVGAIVGAMLAVRIDDSWFNKILAVVMLIVVIATIWNPGRKLEEIQERMSSRHQLIGMVVFFFIGIYGGFIQAGTGLLIMSALALIHRFSLVKANSAKVLVAFIYTVAAILVFLWNGQINWLYGLSLAVGTSVGGWLASRWSVKKGDRWIRWFMMGAVAVMAVRLWFFS